MSRTLVMEAITPQLQELSLEQAENAVGGLKAHKPKPKPKPRPRQGFVQDIIVGGGHVIIGWTPLPCNRHR